MKMNLDSIVPFVVDDIGLVLFFIVYLLILVAVIWFDVKE